MMNNKVKDFFEAQAKREQEAKQVELKAMIDTFGVDAVLGAMLDHLREINKAVSEATKEEQAVRPEIEKEIDQIEDAKEIISTRRYLQACDFIDGKQTSRPVEFSSETYKVLEQVSKATGAPVYEKGSGEKHAGTIGHKGFACYIIKAAGNNGDILTDIINILKDAAWDGGWGITADKMEIVYHALVLHYKRKAEVIPVITQLLKDFDMTSLKVTANQQDEYRNHLSYKEKMMMFVEDEVCRKIGEAPLFARNIA